MDCSATYTALTAAGHKVLLVAYATSGPKLYPSHADSEIDLVQQCKSQDTAERSSSRRRTLSLLGASSGVSQSEPRSSGTTRKTQIYVRLNGVVNGTMSSDHATTISVYFNGTPAATVCYILSDTAAGTLLFNPRA